MVGFRWMIGLLALAVASPVAAMPGSLVYDTIPYEQVEAWGDNNEQDVNSQACDFVRGCVGRNLELCSTNPSQPCVLPRVPRGRCVTGASGNLWPRRAGQCAGTSGYFVKGGLLKEAVTYAGLPCLTDTYVTALSNAIDEIPGAATTLTSIETTSGASAMCPRGINQGGTNTSYPDATGTCDMSTNANRANCQGLVDDVSSPGDQIPLGGGAGTGGGDGTNPTFEQAICSGASPRCSDGDSTFDIGGYGTAMCTDLEILGQIDSQVSCGKNAGTAVLDSPRDKVENPAQLFTGQRDPDGAGFVGNGVIRRKRNTAIYRVQQYADALAKTLGVRFIERVGNTVWFDSAFSAKEENGGLDNIILSLPCDPPEAWETQYPVRGQCSHNPAIFCIKNATCSALSPGATCVSRVYCHNDTEDEPGFLWSRNIVAGEAVPAEASALGWTTTGGVGTATCPPVCGTAYDHTTLEQEALTAVGLQDRDSGIHLALKVLAGRQAGAGDLIMGSSSTTVAWVNQGDLRCPLGGPDPNNPNPNMVGLCESSRTLCDITLPDVGPGSECGEFEECVACGGTHTTFDAGQGNADALPVGYSDGGQSALALIANNRLGVLNEFPITLRVRIFTVGTTGNVGARMIDNSCTTDRCVLGQPPVPGAVGIRTGGSFGIGQAYPWGGANASGGVVSYAAENTPPDTGPAPFVKLKSVGVGAGGIPGCHGNNLPENSAAQACRKRLGRGNEVDSAWGYCSIPTDPNKPELCESNLCVGGGRGGKPCVVAGDCPGSLNCSGVAATYCPAGHGVCNVALVPGGNWDNPADFLYQVNTGKDDPEILVELETVGTPQSGAKPRFLVPNPTAAKPILHGAGATTLRDLDVIDVDSTDVVVKINMTNCPISTVTGEPDCTLDPCAALGGDADADGVCQNSDNCPTVANGLAQAAVPNVGNQTNSDTDTIGNACDNCPLVSNPVVTAAGVFTTTGGQPDDDADGMGNACDTKFNKSAFPATVGGADTTQYVSCIGKNPGNLAVSCGTKGDKAICFNADGKNPFPSTIGGADTTAYAASIGKVPKKCPACGPPYPNAALPCVGPACPGGAGVRTCATAP